jgi:Na+/H+ antiporter NhaD/arsenite permease-like protein
MSLGALCVAALGVVIVISCFTKLNVGVLSIGIAWIIGVYIADLPGASIIAGFPTALFLTLVGVTLLFSLAQSNGTLDRVARHAVRTCRGNRGLVATMYFVMAAALATIGPGNIATAAILAPMAMSTAERVGIPAFLMAIMVGNGANAGALSPFAPTGIIVSGIMTKIGMPGFEWESYAYNLVGHALVAFGGFFLFGGVKLLTRGVAATPVANTIPNGVPNGVPRAGDPDCPPEDDEPIDFRHWLTIGVVTALIVSVILFDVNVGMGAFVCAVILVLARAADDGAAIKAMPWGVIVMVCGVTVLIGLLEKTQGIELLVSLIARLSTAESVTAVVALLTGLVSVYASTSGVVLPAFLPMVPGLALTLGVTDASAIAQSMNVGAHLVDVSPLSTIGALCIASAAAGTDTRRLFNQLLAWGLSMCVVGAVVCYFMFGP